MATNNSINSLDPIQVALGGTGAATITGVLIGNGTSAVTASTVTQYGTVIAGTSNAVSSVAPSATSGVPYISQGAASNPVFGTAVVAGGGTGLTGATVGGIFVGSSTTAFTNLTIGTNTQVLTSNGTTAVWSAATLGVTWAATTVNASIVAGNGYIANKAGLLTMTLPASGSIGDIFEITGINTAVGWRIAQNASQQIFFGTSSSTVGAGGYIEATAIRDSVKCICVVAGASTVWNVVTSVGNITVV